MVRCDLTKPKVKVYWVKHEDVLWDTDDFGWFNTDHIPLVLHDCPIGEGNGRHIFADWTNWNYGPYTTKRKWWKFWA